MKLALAKTQDIDKQNSERILSLVRKRQTRHNLIEIGGHIRKCYMGKLYVSFKLKYEHECMPWAHVMKTSLNSHKYICIIFIYYVVKRLVNCKIMIQKRLLHYRVIVCRRWTNTSTASSLWLCRGMDLSLSYYFINS